MTTVKILFRPSSVTGKEGTLYYRVTHNRLTRLVATLYHLYPDEWERGKVRLSAPHASPERRRYLADIAERMEKDCRLIRSLASQLERGGQAFTTDRLVDAFRTHLADDSLYFCGFARTVIRQLRERGKERLAETYTAAVNSFLRFRGNRGDLLPEALTADLMAAYEAYLHVLGLVTNTISFYLRNLRALYNRAVEQGLTDDRSPFRHVYTGVDKTLKRTVPLAVIARIKSLDLTHSPALALSRDLFLFSFYTRGMSFVDMAYLKKKNLQSGQLTYRRQKTGQLLLVKWEPVMQEIVARYADPASPYLLPIILRPGVGERRQYLTALHRQNILLKEIGRLVQSPVPLTSYVARHGWASIAKSKNVPVSVISEAMGHESEKTTRIYLASLDASVIDRANSAIINSVNADDTDDF